jgi:hypothetical protein
MLQIAGYDDLSTGPDRRCQHVPVAWIGEHESFAEGSVPVNKAVPDRLVHQLPEAVQPG